MTLVEKGPDDIDPPGIKEASIIRSSTGRGDQRDGSQPTAKVLGAGRHRAAGIKKRRSSDPRQGSSSSA